MSKILVVEDEEYLLDNMLETLEIRGYDATGATNGDEGIQQAFALLPDLIICDISMPGKDGYMVLMELRSHPLTSHIPFVFVTAHADRASQRHGMGLGANDYLTKPFQPQELLAMVDTQMGLLASRREAEEARLDSLRNNIIFALPHELRTPLMGILSGIEIMAMDFEGNHDPKSQRAMQMLEIMSRAGLRLHALIENYLIYAQLELIDTDENRRRALFGSRYLATPGEIITRIAQREAELANRQGDLVLNGVADVPVQMAPDNVKKLISELVSNGFKFSTEGQSVTVTVDVRATDYQICVQDSGRGMTPEEVQQIGAYMQFQRQMYEQQGAGLGLIIAKRLVELHSGEFTIETGEGGGTAITATLLRAELET